MLKSTKEFETAMRQVLIKLRDGEDYHSLTNYDSADLDEALVKCSEYGYIANVSAYRNEAGSFQIDCANPKVTYDGLKFIESHANAL